MMILVYVLGVTVAGLLIYVAKVREQLNTRNEDLVFLKDEYSKLDRMKDELVSFIEYKKLENESLDYIAERNSCYGWFDVEAIEKVRNVEKQIG